MMMMMMMMMTMMTGYKRLRETLSKIFEAEK